ncbi:oligosaccharyl transferase, STT3 subunit [Kipferlia bialata]|uniref:dolichyl-diphosphooligosaccharide--protein glycotransferase n=1 Tax=Kipferlia bialata TaxID=797122 RepID=A0A9K3CQS6_9EUKA|nr:oligosaccharyl transferase, STT3 subunit [Kipferlia bialata]|eukprot:g2551.t1
MFHKDRFVILGLCFLLAFTVRLLSIVRYESVIHEFDPFFAYRSVLYLMERGLTQFLEWFDNRSWYPLGRIIGATCFPGLMLTAGALHKVLDIAGLPFRVRSVCVFVAPVFSGVTSLCAYGLGSELGTQASGVMAAVLVAVVPGYIQRSVAGSFDNEAVAITALLAVLLAVVKAVKGGSLLLTSVAACLYFYMASSWGAYVFIINLVPLFALTAMLAQGRLRQSLFRFYTLFYPMGIFLSMQIRFIGTQPVRTAEHMAAAGVFVLMLGVEAYTWLRRHLSAERVRYLAARVLLFAVGAAVCGLVGLMLCGAISPWTGRFKTFLDPTYAKKHIPIIASISEHQPSTWASFFLDTHLLALVLPAALYVLFTTKASYAATMLALYCMCAVYFSGVMIRMVLILAPAACLLGGLLLARLLDRSALLLSLSLSKAEETKKDKKDKRDKKEKEGDKPASRPHLFLGSLVLVGFCAFILFAFQKHALWASNIYSSPSVVQIAPMPDGGRMVLDDYREAFAWLEYNTSPNAKVLSWWDYGYQLEQMANRTVIVDNNTWNTTMLGRVGAMFASDEETAWRLANEYDVDYVLVMFGGVIGQHDDISKFLWIIRVAEEEHFPDIPEIREGDFYNAKGDYRVDSAGSERFRESLMYKLSFHEFNDLPTGHVKGYDRTRNQMVTDPVTLTRFEPVYTSTHWLCRLYRVKRPENM